MPIKKINTYLKEFEREAIAGRPWDQSRDVAIYAFSKLKAGPLLKIRARLRQLFPWLYVNVRDIPLAIRWLSRLTGRSEEARKRQWLRHLAMHSAIFSNEVVDVESSLDGEKETWVLIRPNLCLEFIQHHLGVLDQKNSSLLSLIAILSAGLGLVVARTDVVLHRQLLIATSAALIIDLLLCLRASLRVRWGELGFTGDREIAFRLHVENLIEGLVSRTARFRAATVLTSICVLMVVFLIAGARAKAVPVGAGRPIPGALIFHDTINFEPGGLCTSTVSATRIGQLVESARRDQWRFVTLEGSADAVPIRRSAAYGNNTGLALARAECVREQLERVGTNGQWPIVTVKVRDAMTRGDDARRSGVQGDRVVRIMVYEAIQEPSVLR